MLGTVLYFIVQAIILTPLQTEITDRLAKAQVPTDITSRVQACTASAMPGLVQRVREDPKWAVSLAMDVWLKQAQAEQIVDDAAPACRPVIDAARSYLARQAG